MDSRIPKLTFGLLALYGATHSSSAYPKLPDLLASHFNARGAANGWQTKPAFYGILVSVSVLAAVIGFAIPKMIAVLPAQLINLPNKNYWLRDEHLAETMAFLSAHFAWFGCALFLLDILVFDYAIQTNLYPHNPPDPARLWYVLAGFLLFTMVWTMRMLAKFLRPTEQN